MSGDRGRVVVAVAAALLLAGGVGGLLWWLSTLPEFWLLWSAAWLAVAVLAPVLILGASAAAVVIALVALGVFAGRRLDRYG
ncbi:MAG: hypothetical protein U9Q74_12725 [Gemmatimonadota bacterium]|nr:hypothetical protein [Gemmatimonadota bacterium]